MIINDTFILRRAPLKDFTTIEVGNGSYPKKPTLF